MQILTKLLKDKLDILPQIASIERIESALGIIGFAESLRAKLRTQWAQVISA